MKIIIVGKTMKDAIAYKDKWASLVPEQRISILGKHYMTFFDGTVVDCISIEEQLRGRMFDIALVQEGVDPFLIDIIVAQLQAYSIIPSWGILRFK